MEIAPNFTQVSSELSGWLEVVAVSSLVWMALHYAGRLVRHRPRIRVSLPGALSLATFPSILGGALTQVTKPSNTSSLLHQDASALYERVPPPRSLVRAEVSPPWQAHPALHGTAPSGRSTPLFPRQALDRLEATTPWQRGAIDLRRTEQRRLRKQTSKSSSAAGPTTHHVVAAGDTLWDIAARILDTDDPRAVARYWPRLHKENVDIIGRDPNLLRPGQVLSLPPRETR